MLDYHLNNLNCLFYKVKYTVEKLIYHQLVLMILNNSNSTITVPDKPLTIAQSKTMPIPR